MAGNSLAIATLSTKIRVFTQLQTAFARTASASCRRPLPHSPQPAKYAAVRPKPRRRQHTENRHERNIRRRAACTQSLHAFEIPRVGQYRRADDQPRQGCPASPIHCRYRLKRHSVRPQRHHRQHQSHHERRCRRYRQQYLSHAKPRDQLKYKPPNKPRNRKSATLLP